MYKFSKRDHVIGKLRAWLRAMNPNSKIELTEHTDIVETRFLESLQLVEYILFLEQESGRTILSEQLDPSGLRTLDETYKRFFASGAGDA